MRFDTKRHWLLALALACAPVGAGAAEQQELLELKNTILNLVDELVAQGVLTPERAEAMKRDAALKAREQAAQAAIAAGGAATVAAGAAASTDVVRVPYVPEFVKDEIRAQVREELRDEVTADVVTIARQERWGTPDALPDWLSGIRLFGDGRVRGAGVFLDENNSTSIPNFQAINAAGGIIPAGEDAFFATTEDLARMQVRVRIGLAAKLSESFSFTTRIATGNDVNPVSRNQTLGDYNRPYDIVLDQAYLQWRLGDVDDGQSLTLRGGRLPNPYMYTSLIWDNDLTFDGLTANYTSPSIGTFRGFANLGGYTLLAQETNVQDGSTNDKYFWGGQLGLEWDITDTIELVVAGSYYDFIDVAGQRNEFNSTAKDWTAPPFLSKGNTVFDIRNSSDPVGTNNLFALASDFELANGIVQFSYTGFDPVAIVLRGDYVRNVGYDESDILARTGAFVEEEATGWITELEVGHREILRRGHWSVFASYRSLERDAVLDAFTDSDFHLGGTDTQGWILGFDLGLATNTWLRTWWLTADEIDGAPLAIDVLLVDLHARF